MQQVTFMSREERIARLSCLGLIGSLNLHRAQSVRRAWLD
jgi:hypothetical protein